MAAGSPDRTTKAVSLLFTSCVRGKNMAPFGAFAYIWVPSLQAKHNLAVPIRAEENPLKAMTASDSCEESSGSIAISFRTLFTRAAWVQAFFLYFFSLGFLSGLLLPSFFLEGF